MIFGSFSRLHLSHTVKNQAFAVLTLTYLFDSLPPSSHCPQPGLHTSSVAPFLFVLPAAARNVFHKYKFDHVQMDLFQLFSGFRLSFGIKSSSWHSRLLLSSPAVLAISLQPQWSLLKASTGGTPSYQRAFKPAVSNLHSPPHPLPFVARPPTPFSSRLRLNVTSSKGSFLASRTDRSLCYTLS